MRRSAVALVVGLALFGCGDAASDATTTTLPEWTSETFDSVVSHCAEVSPSQADSCAEFVTAIQADGCTVDDTMRILDERAAGNLVDAVSICRPFIRQPDLANLFRDGLAEKADCISCGRCFAETLKHGLACGVVSGAE